MNRPSGPRTIHLPRTTHPPSSGDLGLMVTEARENEGSEVELTWVPPGGAGTFQLTVCLATGAPEPLWTLTVDDGKQSKQIWSIGDSRLDSVRGAVGRVSGVGEFELSAATDFSRPAELSRTQGMSPPLAPSDKAPDLEPSQPADSSSPQDSPPRTDFSRPPGSSRPAESRPADSSFTRPSAFDSSFTRDSSQPADSSPPPGSSVAQGSSRPADSSPPPGLPVGQGSSRPADSSPPPGLPVGQGSSRAAGSSPPPGSSVTQHSSRPDADTPRGAPLAVKVKDRSGLLEEGDELQFLDAETAQGPQTLLDHLVNPATGLYSYAALLKFLEYEFYRFEAYRVPLSLLVFEMAGLDGESVPVQAQVTAAMRIALVQRQLDVVGHFEDMEFAMVLPNTQPSTAAHMAAKLFETLIASPLAPGLNKSTLKLSFGIATVPDDASDVESLIAVAKGAMSRAKQARESAQSERQT